MSVYREQATDRSILFCPRCNVLLDQVDFGVDMCPSCEGFWIGTSVLELSGNQWPAGPQAWWRNELRCPACASIGAATVMNARTSSDIIIDQCFTHGVWLDRGELARVMRDPVVKEHTKLREHLAALAPTQDQLAERRERWRAEQDERARLADVERKRIATERAKKLAEEAQTEQQRAEANRLAHEAQLREVERLAEARRQVEREAEAKRAEWERIQAEIRIEEDRAAIAEAERERQRPIVLAAEQRAADERMRAIIQERARAEAAGRAMAQARELEQQERRIRELNAERLRLENEGRLGTRVEHLELARRAAFAAVLECEAKLVRAREVLADADAALAAARAETE